MELILLNNPLKQRVNVPPGLLQHLLYRGQVLAALFNDSRVDLLLRC